MPAARILAGLAAVALAAGVCASVTLAAAAAAAAPPPAVDLLVSADGIHFSSEFAGGLFDGSGLLVPRGSIASDLWIRNPTAAPAVLRVSARGVTVSSSDLADGVTMSAWNSGTDTTRSATLRTIAQCQILVPSQSIAAGATMKMVVTYTMADFTGVTAQHDNASVGLMVSMRDAEAGAFPASACTDDGVLISATPARTGSLPTGSLPRTGTDLAVPLLVTGCFLVGVGLFLVAGRRRREHDES
jgi:LPXTG-motif cell wall-anchored protein